MTDLDTIIGLCPFILSAGGLLDKLEFAGESINGFEQDDTMRVSEVEDLDCSELKVSL